MKYADVGDALVKLGIINTKVGGIQANGAFGTNKKGELKVHCDNVQCKLGYECNVATTNKPLEKYVDADSFVQAINNAYGALLISRERFLGESFSDPQSGFTKLLNKYSRLEPYGEAIYNVLKKGLESKKADCNFIGGEFSRHPDCTYILSGVKENKNILTSFTTNGIRLMTDGDFFDEIVSGASGPLVNTIALSVDHPITLDIIEASADELEELYHEKLGVYRARKVGSGQELKTIAALSNLARIYEEKKEGTVGTLINTVLSPVNIEQIRDMRAAIQTRFPKTIQNQYASQSSFDRETPKFNAESIGAYRDHVYYMLGEQKESNTDVKRIGHWLLQKSILDAWSEDKAIKGVSGYGAWNCSNAVPSYLQIGPPLSVPANADMIEAYLACLWDKGVTSSTPANRMTPIQIYDGYLQAMPSFGSCPGCGMPRIEDDFLRILSGLNPELVGIFLDGADEYVWSWIAQNLN